MKRKINNEVVSEKFVALKSQASSDDILELENRLTKLDKKLKKRKLEIIPLQLSWQILMIIPISVTFALYLVDRVIPPFVMSPDTPKICKNTFFNCHKDISRLFLKSIKEEQ